MKFLFYVCCFILQFIYIGMDKYRSVPLVQMALGPMDIFLALAIPIGFSRSIIAFRKAGGFTYQGIGYALGFLLLFTVSQIMHCTVGSITSDALAMTEGPPIEEKIAQLVNRALYAPNVDERANAACLMYLVSGVKTMYQAEDNQYAVFKPSDEEREEREIWNRSNTRVDVLRNEILDQIIAINHRAIFHISSFFVLISIILLVEARRVS